LLNSTTILKIKEVAESKKITRYQINRDTGIPYKSLDLIFKGKAEKLYIQHLIIIATYLNVSIADLFTKEKIVD